LQKHERTEQVSQEFQAPSDRSSITVTVRHADAGIIAIATKLF